MGTLSGILYIIPTTISEDTLDSIPVHTVSVMHQLRYFITEKARTARRYLSATSFPVAIQELHIIELNKNDDSAQLSALDWLKQGHNVGIISESGMPGVADPGMILVRLAHENNIKVSPLTGPSSIFLALAASGLNGQNFSFEGYLPIRENDLKNEIKRIENKVHRDKSTHIFIETPYRNDRMVSYLIRTLKDNTLLSIAIDISGSKECILTKSISEWRKMKDYNIGKIPAIFLIGL